MKKSSYFLLILLIIANTLYSQSNANQQINITFTLHAPGLPSDSSIYITGSLEQLGFWRPDTIKMKRQENNSWIKKIVIERPRKFEYKFTRGSWENEAADSNGFPLLNFRAKVSTDTVMTNEVLFWGSKDHHQRVSTITGTVKYHHDFKGDSVLPRDVLVWLPPGYQQDSTKHYPVLYMHDGQNVFDAATASFGNEWRADETCDSLINAGKIQPLIIVAINNTDERGSEYAPGNKGKAYMDFLVNTLKPFIDATYRTKPSAANTVIAGASSGGTVSFMLAWEYPDIFSKAICMSPAFKIAEIDYIKVVRGTKEYKNIFIYINNGGIDLELRLQPGIDKMITVLKEKGYMQGKDFELLVDPTALHNEVAWANRLPKALQLCFPFND